MEAPPAEDAEAHPEPIQSCPLLLPGPVVLAGSLSLPPTSQVTDIHGVFCSDSGRGSSLLDRTIADRRQLNTITLPDFSDPETGENPKPEGTKWCPRGRGAGH